MNLATYYGAAIRHHREGLRLSQEELASRAGLDRTYISGIERGVRNPTLQIMQRIADALEADLDAIFATARNLGLERKS